MGVNRLSMGVQSFDDVELRWLGRIHSAEEAAEAFRAARRAGFANINLDFIFGLPDQNPAAWARTLAQAVHLAPEHLSLYSLTVEPGTPLFEQARRGALTEPDDDLAAELYELACDALAAGGYEQYEISNWAWVANGKQQMANGKRQEVHAEPAICSLQSAITFQCRHNLVYWRHEPYLGFGAGAHSFSGERRWWNVRPVPEYIRRMEAGQTPESEGEAIDRRLAMGETMMLGLRLVREGVADARFQARFGVGLEEAFGAEIAYVGSWADPAKAKELALAQIASGVDVIDGSASVGYDGIIEAVKQAEREGKTVYTITDMVLKSDFPKQIMAAHTQDHGPMVLNYAEEVKNGTFKGGIFRPGLKSGLIYLKMTDSVPADVKAKVEAGAAGPHRRQDHRERALHRIVGRMREGQATAWPSLWQDRGVTMADAEPVMLRWRGSASDSPALSLTTAWISMSGRAKCMRCSARTAQAKPRS